MADFEDWRRLAEIALEGRDFSTLQSRTRDGILIEPLYLPRTDCSPLRARGSNHWVVVQIIDRADPEDANAQALEDVRGGVTGLALRFAESGNRNGLPATDEALRVVCQNIDLAAVHVWLEPHSEGARIASWLGDLVARRGIAPERTRISFGLDPTDGPAPDARAAACVACFRDLGAAGFVGALAALDARPVHEAGGSEAQELAAILAYAAWWLRALEAAGVTANDAFPRLAARLAVDRDQLLSTAKLRALRLLWRRLQELCGAAPSRLPIHAETSRRMMTRADPHGNIVRTTIAAFAASIGGADSIAVLPFTEALGPADRQARALARSTQHLLTGEAHLHWVADPAAGSGAIEALTDALAAAAWAEFQAIEREGGIVASFASSAFQARIGAARKALAAEVADDKVPLVGATIFRAAGGDPPRADGDVRVPAIDALPVVRLEDLAASP